MKQPKALILMHAGFEEIEAVSTIDILNRGGIEITLASLTDKLNVKGAQGLEVSTHKNVSAISADDFEVVVIPGGPGVFKIRKNETVLEIIKKQHEANKLVAAICAAPIILKEAGVLPNSYTAHFSVKDELPKIKEDLVVQDGNIITSQGPGTAMHFAFKILENLTSANIVSTLKKGTCFNLLRS